MMAELESGPRAEVLRHIPLRRDWSQLIDDLRYVGSTAVEISNELSVQRVCGVDASRLLSGECIDRRRRQFFLDAAVGSWSHAFAAEQLEGEAHSYVLRIYNDEDDCLLAIRLDGESARDHFEALVSLYADNGVSGGRCAGCAGCARATAAACRQDGEPVSAFDPALVPELLEVLTDNALPLLIGVEKAHARHCCEGVLSSYRPSGDASVLFDEGYSLTVMHGKIGRACLTPADVQTGCRTVQLYDNAYRRALTLGISPAADPAEATRWRKIIASLSAAGGPLC